MTFLCDGVCIERFGRQQGRFRLPLSFRAPPVSRHHTLIPTINVLFVPFPVPGIKGAMALDDEMDDAAFPSTCFVVTKQSLAESGWVMVGRAGGECS